MRFLFKTALVLLGILSLGRAPVFGQETWIAGLAVAPGLRSTSLEIYQAVPWGDGWAVGFVNNTNTKDRMSGLARLDRHGNLQWSLADQGKGKLRYRPIFAPLRNGNLLFFQGGSTSGQCLNLGSNLTEVTPEGTVVRERFLDTLWIGESAIQLQNGDILLNTSDLVRIKADLSGLAWARAIWSDPRVAGLGEGSTCLLEKEDGTLVVVGKYGATGPDGNLYYRHYVARMGEDGSLLSYKTYEEDPARYSLEFTSIVPIPGGGYWLAGGVLNVPIMEVDSSPYLARLTEEGEIVEQKVFCTVGNCAGGGFSSILATPGGGLIAVGAVNAPPMDWPSGFVMRLDSSGNPEGMNLINDFRIPAPYLDITFSQITAAQNGYIVSTSADIYGTPPWLFRLDQEGNLQGECGAVFLQPQVTADAIQVLTPCTDTLVPVPLSYNGMCDAGTTMVQKSVLTSSMICGDSYPGIMAATPLQNPFRLKVMGWNFQAGSRAFVNGSEVPATAYKGVDAKTNQAKLILSGGKSLSQMLPKGQPVCITVVNPDGRESVCFPFTR